MLESDYEAFAEELNTLAERLPKKLTPRLVEAYFNTLKKYPLSTIRFVMEHWPKHGGHKKFPLESELLSAVKAKSTVEYAKKQDADLDYDRKLKVLEDEFTLICKQICANGINTKALMENPIMRKLMKANGKVAEQINRDYSAHKTDLTNEQLYQRQQEVRDKISNMRK